jgi:hypothetical protein
VRSHEFASSSSDESDAKDDAVFEGGNIRNLMLLWRQRGVGIESYTEIIYQIMMIPTLALKHLLGTGNGGDD